MPRHGDRKPQSDRVQRLKLSDGISSFTDPISGNREAGGDRRRARGPRTVESASVDDAYLDDLASRITLARPSRSPSTRERRGEHLGPKFLRRIGCEVDAIFAERTGDSRTTF